MKKHPTILQKDTLVGIMLRTLVLFCITAGVVLGSKSSQNFLSKEQGYFLKSTSISAPPIYFAGTDSQESAAIESEEKEEKETESENENPDQWIGSQSMGLVMSSITGQSSNYEDQSQSFRKQKRYILFHCLKSDIA